MKLIGLVYHMISDGNLKFAQLLRNALVDKVLRVSAIVTLCLFGRLLYCTLGWHYRHVSAGIIVALLLYSLMKALKCITLGSSEHHMTCIIYHTV